MIHHATSVLVLTAWLGALTFVIRYLATYWFRTRMGVHLMAFMAVCLVVLSIGVVRQFWPDLAILPVLRLVSYALINCVLWWRVVLLFQGQREIPKIPPDPGREDGTATNPRGISVR